MTLVDFPSDMHTCIQPSRENDVIKSYIKEKRGWTAYQQITTDDNVTFHIRPLHGLSILVF